MFNQPSFNQQNNNLLNDSSLNKGNLIEFCEKIQKILGKKRLSPLKEMENPERLRLDKEGLNSEELKLAVQWAGNLATNDFKMSSLRKIYDMFSSPQNIERIKFILAYEVGRKREFTEFGKFLEGLLNRAKSDYKKVEKIKTFLEAVIAYHKLINPKG